MTVRKGQRIRRLRAAFALAAATAAAVAVGAAAASAQEGNAQLRGIVFDSTRMEVLAGARVAILGTNVMGDADAEGRFRLEGVPSGSYWVSFFHPRLQALGVSPPSRQVDFQEGATATIELSVPSERTLLMGWCMAEQVGPGYGALAGVVTDSLTGVPLPRAIVTASLVQRRPGDPTEVEARTDEQGYYRLCTVPADREVKVQAHFGQNSGRSIVTGVAAGDARSQDLVLLMSANGILRGTVLDYVSGEPLEGAVVSVIGTTSRQVSTPEGDFLLDDLPPGRHLIVTEYLGYEARTDSVTVFSQETVDMEVRMAQEALEVEGLVVTARTRFGRTSLASDAKRADYITREEIEPLLPRVRSVGDILRTMNAPGLSVREMRMADPTTGIIIPAVCVELTRRTRGSAGCSQVALFINDVIMPVPEEVFRDLDPNVVQRIEILSPIDAQFQFGTMAGNGAILIYTR